MSELAYPAYESSEVSAREVIQLLRRRRWTVLGTFFLSIALAAIVTPMMTPIYRARATMLIEEAPQASSPTPHDAGVGEGPMLNPMEPLPIDTQVEVLQSGPLWRKVMQRIGPLPNGAYPTLTVAQRSKTNIIEVTAESTVPSVARDAPNLLVNEYIEQTRESRGETLHRTRRFVEDRLAEAQTELGQADARLRDFKEQHHITDLNADKDGAIKAASAIGEELRLKENELTSLRSQIHEIQTKLRREQVVVQGSYTDLPNPEIGRLQTQIQTLEQQRIGLLEHLKEGEPQVRTLDRQIASLR